jgi:hypothetical protein
MLGLEKKDISLFISAQFTHSWLVEKHSRQSCSFQSSNEMSFMVIQTPQ